MISYRLRARIPDRSMMKMVMVIMAQLKELFIAGADVAVAVAGIGGRREIMIGAAVDLFAVEVAVAVAGGAG